MHEVDNILCKNKTTNGDIEYCSILLIPPLWTFTLCIRCLDPTQQVGGNNVTLEVQYGFGQDSHKKRRMFYSKSKTTMAGASIPNPRGFHCSLQWIRTSRRRRLCVVCIKNVSWYCLTCDDIMICFGAYFVESHSKSTCIIC
jgi:hypothetical protein